MAEIKVNDGFYTEIAEFKKSADGLINQDYFKVNAGDDLSLPAIDEYIDRLYRLHDQMFRMKLLVEKDAKDFKSLADSLKNVDQI